MTYQMNPELENICGDIINNFQGELIWQWDGRFNTVLIEFTTDYNEKVLSVINRHLNSIWNSSNIEEAPNIVQVISAKMGGLRAGQTMFTSDQDQDALVFCAWWPWGNGSKVSIRLATCYENLSDNDMAELVTQLKNRFSI